MTGKFITPGTLCATTSRPTDGGTRCLFESPAPGFRGRTGAPHVDFEAVVDQTDQQRERMQQNMTYLKDANVRAFLVAISKSEGGEYNLKFGCLKGRENDPYVFYDFSTYPGAGYRGQTAAGMYQINRATWREMGGERMGVSDFTPAHQDLMAIEIIRTEGAIEDVISGDLTKALPKVSGRWAALPQGPGKGNKYPSQTFKSYEVFLKYFQEAGGTVKTDKKHPGK